MNKLITSGIIVAVLSFTTGVIIVDNQKPTPIETNPSSHVTSNTPTETPTPPATDPTDSTPDLTQNVTKVQAVDNTTPAPATQPNVPVVKSYRQIPLDGGNIDCEYTYSDGTTKQFSWTVVNPQGGWAEDGNGQNGHYIPVTQVTGTCDDSILGTPKY